MNTRRTLGISLMIIGLLAFILFVTDYVQATSSFGFQLATSSGNLIYPPFGFYLVTAISAMVVVMGIAVMVSEGK